MASDQSDKIRTLKGKCPICDAQTSYHYRPFCSRRCADRDLANWLKGSYAIPVLADEDEDGEGADAAQEPAREAQPATGEES